MKKLLALVLLFSFVFTSCSYRQEDKETLPITQVETIVTTLVGTEPVVLIKNTVKPTTTKKTKPTTTTTVVKTETTEVVPQSPVTEFTAVTTPKATTAKTKVTPTPETTKKPLELKDLPAVLQTSHGKMAALKEKKINNLYLVDTKGFELISVTIEYVLIDERYEKESKKLKVWDFGYGAANMIFKIKVNMPGKYFYHATVRNIETGELYNTNVGWFLIGDKNYKDLNKDGIANNPTFKKKINKTFDYKFEG